MDLQRFEVTVVRFDPGDGPDAATAETYVLPVDSPDEEHAMSAAMSNAVAFTIKYSDGDVRPIAFTATGVRQRP